MRVDYLSDLHIDFFIKEINPGNKLNDKIKNYADDLNLCGGEVLIVAGDLGHYFIQDSAFLLYMKELYTNVLFVYGNHDFYLVSEGQRKKYKNSWNRINELKEFCLLNDINYLDGNSVTINDVKFSGAGMSWDKSFIENLRCCSVGDDEVIQLYNKTMSDSRLIIQGQLEKFNPFKFFQNELNKLQNIESTDVMISHYGPCLPPAMNPEYSTSEISTFFYFDGKKELERLKPKFWVYGHTHTPAYYNYNDTVMASNPIGYPNENCLPRVLSFNIGE